VKRKSLTKKPTIEVGRAIDYHENDQSSCYALGRIVTYKLDGHDITIELNEDGSLDIRNNNGFIQLEPVVANVIRVRGVVR
jgi:hypothetical protein